MRFYIVGPTASGKSDLAAEVAQRLGAEIVSSDAFQVYRGLDLLTAKPDAATLARVPHHLIGEVALTETMNAAKFAARAAQSINDITGRGRGVLVVGGTGLYVRALTHGLSPLPETDARLRGELEGVPLAELVAKLRERDPQSAVDMKNRRRVVRALEISFTTGLPASAQREQASVDESGGVFVFRDRAELYARIDARVEQMFAAGVVEEMRTAGEIGATASQMLGLKEIRQFIAGEISRAECIAKIQQATRRYAKRQLTWFRRQTNFEPLNLSERSSSEAVEWIVAKARLSFAHD